MLRQLSHGLLYFALVFAIGFVLGAFRVLILVPMLGERWAELVEIPFMLVAVVLSARWVVARMEGATTALDGIFVGGIGLCLLLLAELGVVFFVRQQTFHEYLATRDPVSGALYLISLLLFAVMPAVQVRRNLSR
jgi:hypothetical protein